MCMIFRCKPHCAKHPRATCWLQALSAWDKDVSKPPVSDKAVHFRTTVEVESNSPGVLENSQSRLFPHLQQQERRRKAAREERCVNQAQRSRGLTSRPRSPSCCLWFSHLLPVLGTECVVADTWYCLFRKSRKYGTHSNNFISGT